MSDGVQGVVVCHGNLAAALVGAVEQIAGATDALVAVTNAECDREALRERIGVAVGDVPTIVFTDLPNGSCVMAALRELQRGHEARIVTGVNLAMLLEFVFHRDGELDATAARLATVGTTAITVP
jgi:mannose/fructose-specific phosphotransferase system component IIA